MTNAPITAGIGLAAVALLGLGAAPPAHAALPDAQRVTYGAFGTLGLIYHERDGIEYRRASTQARGAEGGELDYETDTLAGVQLNGAWSAQLSGTIQAVTRLTARGNWRPHLTRAAVRYQLGAHVQVSGGRIGWEIFPLADSRNVGYSQLAIRPPVEVFGFIPQDHFDGAQLRWTYPLGAGLMTSEAYGGTIEATVTRNDGSINDLDGSKIWGGDIEYGVDAWLVRLGFGVFQLDELPDYGNLEAGLRQSGDAAAIALADTLADGDRSIRFLTAGLNYDRGPLQVRMFLGRADIDNFAGPDIYTGSLVAGLRLNDVTPYLVLASIENQRRTQTTGLPDDPEHAALNAGARAAQAPTRYNQHSVAVGLRYDIAPNLALKGQIDRLRLRDSSLHFDRRDDAAGRDADLTVFGLALDFIW